MRDKCKTVSEQLVGIVTATEPQTRRRFRKEEESMGEDRSRHGEKEKHRGRHVGKTEM